jgi:EVE domain
MPNWIAVASANHVAIGRAEGFAQVNHGKSAPLRRMAAGDLLAYYSPVTTYGGTDRLQAFTALGRIRPGEPYQGQMGEGFTPFRRDVDWLPATQAAIAPLLERLEFTQGRRNWGYAFRFGLFSVSDADMSRIAAAMGCVIALA